MVERPRLWFIGTHFLRQYANRPRDNESVASKTTIFLYILLITSYSYINTFYPLYKVKHAIFLANKTTTITKDQPKRNT